MNSLPKFVATRTLEHLEWNATPLKGDVVEEVTRLKQQPGQNLLIYGSGELVHTLMQHNLIDEYRLLVYPVVLGKGGRPRTLGPKDLAAAKALLADPAIRVEDVAARLKVSPATLYRHLPGGRSAVLAKEQDRGVRA